jgi:hypothetical protein
MIADKKPLPGKTGSSSKGSKESFLEDSSSSENEEQVELLTKKVR